MLRREGTEGGSKHCVAAQSTTLPTSESLLLGESFMDGLKSGKDIRQFLVACMDFSTVSTGPDKLSLQSADSPNFSQLYSVWYSSGFLSGDGWSLRAGSARGSDLKSMIVYWYVCLDADYKKR